MVDVGILTDADAVSHPVVGCLERAVGVFPSVEVDISPTLELNGGELFLLCSDGLHGYVSDSEIAVILNMRIPLQAMALELVDLALGKGGEDNITVQLVGNDYRNQSNQSV
jgi:protein phosphatase